MNHSLKSSADFRSCLAYLLVVASAVSLSACGKGLGDLAGDVESDASLAGLTIKGCTYQEPVVPKGNLCQYKGPDGRSLNKTTCIPSGTDADIQRALDQGASAVLCPGARFTISKTLHFTRECQALITQGARLPDGHVGPDSDAAVIKTVDHAKFSRMVDSLDHSDFWISNITFDGNRHVNGRIAGGAALQLGGTNAHNQHVSNVAVRDTSGWSALAYYQGNGNTCTDGIVEYNQVTSLTAGTKDTDSDHVSDGISIACKNMRVRNNEVVNATDGGIVIFGSPYSIFQNNTITSTDYGMLGGINMVDYAPFNGDYSCTVAAQNKIQANKHINSGIAIGPYVWGSTNHVSGGWVIQNTVTGHLKYGVAMSGVQNFRVQNNAVNANVSGHNYAWDRNHVSSISLGDAPAGSARDRTSNMTNGSPAAVTDDDDVNKAY